MERPIWLDDEPTIKQLLNTVVDRFETQSANDRLRDIVLTAEKVLPVLQQHNAQADRAWGYILDLAQRGLLQVNKSKRGPYDADWTGAKLRFALHSETILREYMQRPSTPSPAARWQQAVLAHAEQLGEHSEWLLTRRLDVSGRRAEDVIAALIKGRALNEPLTLRQLSARLFWGNSKVLDQREEWVRTLFPTLQLQTRAIVIAAHVPAQWQSVVFIENQDCYTLACNGYYPSLLQQALVYGSGFRSSAERIREHDGAALQFTETSDTADRQRFVQWWFNRSPITPTCSFWGDLDFAAMHMLRLLRQRFGNVVALRAAYEKMLALARQDHHYCPAQEANQTDPGETGCPYADTELLPAIRQWGAVDQEILPPF